MKHPKEELERWLMQADHDLQVARVNNGVEAFGERVGRRRKKRWNWRKE